MCFYFHHLVFECIPFLCAALDGEIAGEWVTGAPTQQWGNHWRTPGVKGGLWWRWCLGSCLGIPKWVHTVRPRPEDCVPTQNCALQTNLIKMFTCRISPERPEMDVRLCREVGSDSERGGLRKQQFKRSCWGSGFDTNVQQLLFVEQHHLLA